MLTVSFNYSSRVVHTLSHNFRGATSVVRAPLRLPIKPDHVLVKIIYAGVNASDVSFKVSSLNKFYCCTVSFMQKFHKHFYVLIRLLFCVWKPYWHLLVVAAPFLSLSEWGSIWCSSAKVINLSESNCPRKYFLL